MKTKPRKLTDNVIATLKHDTRDTQVPGLSVRVLDGAKTFVMIGRFPGSTNPTRRALGRWLAPDVRERARAAYDALPPKDRPATFDAYLLATYGATNIDAAREKAMQWKQLLRDSRDPAAVEAAARAAMAKSAENTFGGIAEQWFSDKVRKERRGYEVERDVSKYFVTPWKTRPIADICASDITTIVKAKKREGAPTMARSMLVNIKRFFQWCVDDTPRTTCPPPFVPLF